MEHKCLVANFFAFIFGFSVLSSCGQTNFASSPSVNSDDIKREPGPITEPPPYKPKDPKPVEITDEIPVEVVDDGPPDGDYVLDQAFALSWGWQCQNSLSLSQEKKDFHGGGDHHLGAKVRPNQITINLDGNLCQPQEKNRDIVIVVDVSNSMSWEDPRSFLTGNCARLQSVSKMVDSLLQSNTTRLALVTFESSVIESSGKFMSVQEFKNNFISSDLLCRAGGGTNYADALDEARSLFENNQSVSNHEVFFITDGEPDDEGESRDAAVLLREKAVIATIMLGNENDTHLKNDVASRDSGNLPLHEVAENADALSEKFAILAKSKLEKASFNYRMIYKNQKEMSEWVEKDLMGFIVNDHFQLPEFKIDLEEKVESVEVELRYSDSFGGEIVEKGRVYWGGE